MNLAEKPDKVHFDISQDRTERNATGPGVSV
jgi:hypothetical protein